MPRAAVQLPRAATPAIPRAVPQIPKAVPPDGRTPPTIRPRPPRAMSSPAGPAKAAAPKTGSIWTAAYTSRDRRRRRRSLSKSRYQASRRYSSEPPRRGTRASLADRRHRSDPTADRSRSPRRTKGPKGRGKSGRGSLRPRATPAKAKPAAAKPKPKPEPPVPMTPDQCWGTSEYSPEEWCSFSNEAAHAAYILALEEHITGPSRHPLPRPSPRRPLRSGSAAADPKSSAKPRSSNPWRQQGRQGAGAKQRKREKRAEWLAKKQAEWALMQRQHSHQRSPSGPSSCACRSRASGHSRSYARCCRCRACRARGSRPC